MRMQLSPQDWQILSDYLDGQLSQSQQQVLAERLKVEPDLRAGLKSLRQTLAVLHSAPRRRVPHNFTLSPSSFPRRAPVWGRLSTVFSFSSALAMVLLVISLALEMVPRLSPAMVSAPRLEAPAVAQEKLSAAAPQTPGPVVLWQEPKGGGGSSAPAGKGGEEPAATPAAPPAPAPALLPPPSAPLAAPTQAPKPPAAPLPPTPTPPPTTPKVATDRVVDASPTSQATQAKSADAGLGVTATRAVEKQPEASPTPGATRTKEPEVAPVPAQPRLAVAATPTLRPTEAAAAARDFTNPILGITLATDTPPPAARSTTGVEASRQTSQDPWPFRLGLLAFALVTGLGAFLLRPKRRK